MLSYKCLLSRVFSVNLSYNTRIIWNTITEPVICPKYSNLLSELKFIVHPNDIRIKSKVIKTCAIIDEIYDIKTNKM